MSQTDQAFIRVYGDAPARASAPSVAAPSPHLDNSFRTENAPVRSTLTATKVVEVLPVDRTTGKHSSVHIGLGSVVPAPHAKFPPVEVARGGTARLAPLSSFTQAAALPREKPASQAALEVDALHWPHVCAALTSQHAAQFDELLDELAASLHEGEHRIAIAGTQRGEGRTTLLLCLAKQAAARGANVLLIDADFARPGLANILNLSLDAGWETAIAGEAAAWDAMIESAADNLSVLPLAAPVAGADVTAAMYRIAGMWSEVSEPFDLVLIDAGPLHDGDGEHWLLDARANIDGVLLAHNVAAGSPSRLASACLRLAEANRRQLGLVELGGQ